MDISEIEAALTSQLSSLQTNDPEEILDKMKAILGDQVTKESCRFFLDASNWDLAKALGTFYDCNLDPTALNRLLRQSFNVNTNEMEVTQAVAYAPDFISYAASVVYNPNDVPTPSEIITVCLKNSGTCQWDFDCVFKAQTDFSHATLITTIDNQCLWSPVSDVYPLPSLKPGEDTHICVKLQKPSTQILAYLQEKRSPVIGACCICNSNGSRFGDTIYFSIVPEFHLNRISYIAGCYIPEEIIQSQNDFDRESQGMLDRYMCG